MSENRTKELLVTILKLGGMISLLVLAPNALVVIDKIFTKNKKFNKGEFNRTIKRLNKIGFIDISIIEGKQVIKLSKKGKQQAVDYILDDIEIKRPAKWDKKWRIVIFDIPETKKRTREAFKRRLLQLGFGQIQKSVYVLPYQCEKELEYIVSVYGIKMYVSYILAEFIDSQKDLIKKYDL
jgi:DNA-binding transcriptional regulator PaaX